jgi:hypothetical protein
LKGKYIGLNTIKNAEDYLKRAEEFICRTNEDNIWWKWVVIALHGSLYGFMVANLEHGNYMRVVTVTKKKINKLISFDEALKRCKDPRFMCLYTISELFRPTPEQDEAIDKMKNMLRNPFEHFIPRIWAIEVHGMPHLMLEIIDVIDFLALRSGNIFYSSSSKRRSVESLMRKCKKHLRNHPLYKEMVSAKQRKAQLKS